MKKKLLYALSAVVFATILSINITSAINDNNQDNQLETLNIVAIANAEDSVHNHGPKHNPLFGKPWCECSNPYDCVE